MQFTVVVPSGNCAPEAGTHAGVNGPSCASAAVAVNGTGAPATLVAGVVMSAGTVSSGGELQNAGSFAG
ncbi:hypothetical protein D3C83_316540 [compost metagenome]